MLIKGALGKRVNMRNTKYMKDLDIVAGYAAKRVACLIFSKYLSLRLNTMR